MFGFKMLTKNKYNELTDVFEEISECAESTIMSPSKYSIIAGNVVRGLSILKSRRRQNMIDRQFAIIKKKNEEKEHIAQLFDTLFTVINRGHLSPTEYANLSELMEIVKSKTGIEWEYDYEPPINVPSLEDEEYERFIEYYHHQQNGEISVAQGCEALGISKTVWYRLRKRLLNEIEE